MSGLITLLVGLGFSHVYILGPIRAARSGVDEILIHEKGVMVATVITCFGGFLTVLGPIVGNAFWPEPEESRLPAWVLSVAFAAVGIAAIFFVMSHLHGLGYQDVPR